MEACYNVVTSEERIDELHRRLCSHLATLFIDPEKRVVGFLRGRKELEVRFSRTGGAGEISAWASRVDETKDLRIHYFLKGQHGLDEMVSTESLLNFPGSSYRRHPAGVFLTDRDGRAFVAHRGRLTKGRQGLKTREVLSLYREKAGYSSVVQADDDGQERSFILIGALDDPALEGGIRQFSKITRDIADELSSPR